MRWLLGVLLVLVIDPRPVRAEKCNQSVRVVPQRGSTLVPSNARIWIAGRAPWSYTLGTASGKLIDIEPTSYSGLHAPVIELQPALEIGEHYTLRDGNGDVITTFLVDRAADHTPPAAPQLPETRGDALDVTVDEDTALLRVELRDYDQPTRTESFLTTPPEYNYVEGEGCSMPVPATSACVRVTAIDLAGNESKTVERCTLRETAIPVAIQSPPAHRDSPRAMLAIAFVIALLVGVFAVFAPEIDMGWLRRRNSGDDLLPAAARQLARTVRRNAIVRAIGALGVGGSAMSLAGSPSAWFIGLAVILVATRQLWLLARAHRMLHLLDRLPAGDQHEARVTLHGDHVLRVRWRGESSWLVCSQRQLALATERVLPMARVVAS